MMTYRAARPLSVIPKGTETPIIYQPGDLIPDFTQWEEVVRRAHLGQGNVVMDLPTGIDQAVRTCSVAAEPIPPPAPPAADEEAEAAPKKGAKSHGKKQQQQHPES